MRLIDADEMLERLEEWNTSDTMDKALYNFAWHRIMEQPTAYDVDKVCEELKFATRKGTLRACDFTGILGTEDYKGAFVNTQQAINIVRREVVGEQE